MNENAKKWVEALRSGTYKQGQLALRREDETFCCLGVACDLYRQAVGGVWRGTEFASRQAPKLTGGLLPDPVQGWLGLRTIDGQDAAGMSLSGHNDRGATFAEIADIIEAEPEGLFT